jgi:1,4-alpha-glucan branching enzyme
VQIIGDFNSWSKDGQAVHLESDHGVWHGFVPGVQFHIVSACNGCAMDKADPFALHAEVSPRTASVVWDQHYAWNDGAWLRHRGRRNAPESPLAIYEVHLGSWRRVPEEGNRSLSYREMALRLAEYVLRMGFTHVELLPVAAAAPHRAGLHRLAGPSG